jgi:hypothetical protein
MALINLPNPSSQFERELVLQLNKYLSDIYNKLQAQQGYKWDAPHPVMGNFHIWIDATGDVRIKSSCPTSDLDGSVIGSQS